MTACIQGPGPIKVDLEREAEFGHRTYNVTWRVKVDPATDGPLTALNCPGLPDYGSTWQFANEFDLWAWCRYTASVKPVVDEEPNTFYTVTQVFSTKPEKDACITQPIENPLLQPPKVSGSFVKYTEEAQLDRFGNPIRNSAFEPIKGPPVEFDGNRPSIKIVMPVASFEQVLQAWQMQDTVNSGPLWGIDIPRTIKLSKVDFDQEWYGQCFPYYKLSLEFDINFDTFDKTLPDEATKVIKGSWAVIDGNNVYVVATFGGQPVSTYDPANYVRAKDVNGENLKSIMLNGDGYPASVGVFTPGTNQWICLEDGTSSVPLGTEGVWIAFDPDYLDGTIANLSSPSDWGPELTYSQGNIVSFGDGFVYVALDANLDIEPSFDDPPGSIWHNCGESFNDQGMFSLAATYDNGDYVLGDSTLDVGAIYVEKYEESDFAALGIPLYFP